MSVDGNTITDPQINRVKTWAIANSNTLVEGWCNVALDPGADPALRAKDRGKVAAKYNDLWPDPQDVITSTASWICPAGVTEIAVECFAAAGDGGTSLSVAGGGGGGGGAYARINTLATTPGNSYTANVGISGGADTWFGSTSTVFADGGSNGGNAALIATPGSGGAGGLAAHCIGDVTWSGGSGSAGTLLASGVGGGGAGEDGDGVAASGTTVGAGGSFGGGSGGASGVAGAINGGGGGAAGLLLGTPGVGGRGVVMLYY